jgi:hypothetical protein
MIFSSGALKSKYRTRSQSRSCYKSELQKSKPLKPEGIHHQFSAEKKYNPASSPLLPDN